MTPSSRKSPLRLIRARYPEPVPEIKRRVTPEPRREFSDETRAKLIMLAVIKTKGWGG